MIDPIRLAQFMLLPGAAELVEAFASLPPGEVRESAVAHIQVLARASGWTAPNPFGGQVETARTVHTSPLRLAASTGLSSASLDGQIVERALRGFNVDAIAFAAGADGPYVESVLRKARREGGVVFPGDDEPAKRKAKPGKGHSKLKGRKLPAAPIPPPPYWWEDPQSPIWENPAYLPNLSHTGNGTLAGIGPHDRRSFKVMADAAARHGLTLRDYIAQRYEILRRVEAGEKPSDIAIDLRVSSYAVYGLLTKVGRNRLAQMVEERAKADEPVRVTEIELVPAAVPIRRDKIRPTPANRAASAKASLEIAAKRWGFETAEDYEAARIRARDLRLRGIAPAHVANMLGVPHGFIRATLTHWRERGVEWPPIDIRAHERDEAAA
jgi:hypothetical protein